MTVDWMTSREGTAHQFGPGVLLGIGNNLQLAVSAPMRSSTGGWMTVGRAENRAGQLLGTPEGPRLGAKQSVAPTYSTAPAPATRTPHGIPLGQQCGSYGRTRAFGWVG